MDIWLLYWIERKERERKIKKKKKTKKEKIILILFLCFYRRDLRTEKLLIFISYINLLLWFYSFLFLIILFNKHWTNIQHWTLNNKHLNNIYIYIYCFILYSLWFISCECVLHVLIAFLFCFISLFFCFSFFFFV